MPTIHAQGPRKVSTWQRARHRVRSDLGLHENRAYHVRLKPYRSHRRDVSPFPFSFTSISPNPIDWFGNKRFVVGILALSVIISGIILSQGPAFHSYAYPSSSSQSGDPTNLLWSLDATNSMSNWNSILAFNLAGTLEFKTNSTTPGIAVSNIPISNLNTAVSREVVIGEVASFLNGTVCLSCFNAMWYLTLSPILPASINTYNPRSDPNVVYEMSVSNCTPNPQPTTCLFQTFQKVNDTSITDTITKEDSGSCNSGTGNSACLFSVTASVNNVQAMDSYLNFTGANGPASGGQNGLSCFLYAQTGSGSSCATLDFNGGSQTVLATGKNVPLAYPSLNLQQNYYIGFFAGKGQNEVTFQNTFNSLFPNNDVVRVFSFLPAATATVPPSPIDTGGFFGPIIKVLIQIAVFMMQNLINFGTFLAGIYWPIFTAIGAALWALLQAAGSSLSAVFVAILNVFEAIVKSLLNTIGQTFGFPASSSCNFASNPGGCGLGDDLFQDISYLISAITASIATFIGGLANIFTAVLNFFTAITTWFTTWGVYFLNAILAIVNLVGEIITVIKNLLLYAPSTFTWGAIVLFIVYSSLDGLQGWYAFFETTAWLVLFGVSAAEKILNWLISTSVWIVSQIPAFNFQVDALTFGGGAGGKYMVGFDLPRLPLLEHNFRPSFPHNFTDPEIARFNIFSIMGLVVGTFMLVYAVGANLVPGVSAANGVNLNLINALLPVGLVMLGALGAVTLPFLLGFLFRNVFGIQISTPSVGLGLSTERISLRTGKVKGPKFKFGVRPSKHKFQVRTEDGKGRTVRGIRNILREGKRQQVASQERLRRETEHLRQQQVQAQRQREHEQRQRTDRRRELGTSPEGFE